MKMPLQSEALAFYGNPASKQDPAKASAAWESANLVYIKAPFNMYYDKQLLQKGLRVHKNCAESLSKVFANLWEASGRSQKVIDEWGVSVFGGCYNYRQKRGGSTLSMHAFGAAIDLDPANNAMYDNTPRFANYPKVIKAFKDEGWVWGGDWSSHDGMHFQAARIK